MEFNPNQSIFDVMKIIEKGDFRLPNIQRGYEWDQDRVTKLFDSIMSGYPIGSIMIWRPEFEILKDIMTRKFVEKYDSSIDYLTDSYHPAEKESYLVLDGQQRLQSLFLSFFGNYNGERLYFKIDHIPSDDEEDTTYIFQFLSDEEHKDKLDFVHVSEILQLDASTKRSFAKKIASELTANIKNNVEKEKISDEKQDVIFTNIDMFIERIKTKKSLLFQEVEHRHNYEHVLEIFERVNSGGMVLEKSDLLFCTLKLKLQEMEKKFIDTINFINQRDRHNFNTDFLIKTCLVIFNMKAKYEVPKLKNDQFINSLKNNYDLVNTCLRQTIAWLDDVALIKCSRFLRSKLALIPILDFMMLSKNYDKPDGENGQYMKEYLYMSFFRRLYARGADTVLDQLHSIMIEEVKKNSKHFPIEKLREYMVNRQNMPYQFENYYFNNDADLIINIVDGGVLQIDPADQTRSPKDLKLEVDHIFPYAPLTHKFGMGDVVNYAGNYRLVVMPLNRRKSAQVPNDSTDFFGRKQEPLETYFKNAIACMKNNDADGLRIQFIKFRDERYNMMKKSVIEFVGI